MFEGLRLSLDKWLCATWMIAFRRLTWNEATGKIAAVD
jgi:hypothetical protein